MEQMARRPGRREFLATGVLLAAGGRADGQGRFLDAVRELSLVSRPGLLFGVERLPEANPTSEKRVSLVLENATAEAIVRQLCDADGRYTYSYDGARDIVNITPRTPPAEYLELQLLPVKPRRMAGNDWPENLFRIYVESTPEVQDYLLRKARDYQARNPRMVPAGRPGVSFQLEGPRPEYDFRLTGKTLREQLNEVAAYTRQMQGVESKSTPSGRIEIYPTGWQFTITPSADAHNGLGGHPMWTYFPQ